MRFVAHVPMTSHTLESYPTSYFVDGNEKIAPSRTPADGQRWVIVFRFV